ncbi:hypothetical protein [Streptomyces laurentii]|uniref:hypothetical protein n=1 Tax=Streptomyces laurentii TaxID=39478 RepID=UPI0036A9B59B
MDVKEIGAVWWRRPVMRQLVPQGTGEAEADLIDNDCRTALLGVLLNDFSGTWISHPYATSIAENKLVQLREARAAGLRVPRTLVSQDPVEIRDFCASSGRDVIVKTVRGCSLQPLLTRRVTDAHLAAEQSIRMAPAIYQEYVPGTRHIRALCLGSDIHAVGIESDELDWRCNLRGLVSGTIRPAALDDATAALVTATLERLHLAMGVVDLKIDPDGLPVWLEVNPQGQFLFMEALSGKDFTGPCVDFLSRQAR